MVMPFLNYFLKGSANKRLNKNALLIKRISEIEIEYRPPKLIDFSLFRDTPL